jgi:hypothetical protein
MQRGRFDRVRASLGSFFAASRRWLERRPRLRRVLPWLGLLVAGATLVAVWSPFLAHRHVDNGLSDWSYRVDYTAYALNAIGRDHQFPYWVTLPRFEQFRIKGVHDFFANPETEVLSIVTPLAAAFDYLVAVKIELVVYLLVGTWGCRRVLRAFGGRGAFPTTLLLALLVLANGALVHHTLAGHTQFVSVAILPVAFALYIEAWKADAGALARMLCAAGCGALLAVAYYGGNVHPLVQFFWFLGLFTLGSLTLDPRSTPRVALAVAAIGAWFFALSAFKLLPGMLDFRDYRANHLLTYDHWIDLARSFVVPWKSAPDFARHELNVYVGWAGVVVLAFAITGWNRRTFPLVVAAGALAWLMFLKAGSPLLQWPVLRTQGVYTRLRIWVVFALAVAAVVRLEAWIAWAERRGGMRAAVPLFVLVVGLDGYLAVDLARSNVAGHVSLSSVHDLPLGEGPFSEAPALTADGDPSVTVGATAWRANAFRYHFEQPEGASSLVIATDLAMKPRPPHLFIRGNGELTSKADKLAVRLHGKQGEFILAFYDPATYAGMALSITATVLLAGLVVGSQIRGYRRRSRVAAARIAFEIEAASGST